MSVIPEPRQPLGSCHPLLAHVLKTEVWRLRCRTRRRLFATSARVQLLACDGSPVDGSPFDGPTADLLATTEAAPDHALRVDIAVGGIGAAIGAHPMERASAALVVVRSGPLEVVEDDRRWSRAWQVACDIVGAGCDRVYAVTRAGWLDVDLLTAVRVPRLRATRRSPGSNPGSQPGGAGRSHEPGRQGP
jgi:hypothetical protein